MFGSSYLSLTGAFRSSFRYILERTKVVYLDITVMVLLCSSSFWTSGEGGTFALFQGLFPPEDNDFDSDRTLTGIWIIHLHLFIAITKTTSGDSFNKAISLRNSGPLRLKETFRWPLLAWVCLSSSHLYVSSTEYWISVYLERV